MKTSRRMSPVTLRITLAVILIALAGLGVGVFMLGYQSITDYSKETQQTAADRIKSQSKVNVLKATQAQLKEHADVVERASQLVSKSEYYVYQDQIIEDISSYATRAGVGLDSITFTDTGANAAAAATSASTTTATASGLPAGVKTTTATVNITSPTNYTNYLRFLHSLEQSLFRMSILNVGMTQVTDPAQLAIDPDSVSCDPLQIEVYIKNQ